MRRESLRAVHIHHLAAAAPHLLPQFHVCVGEVREGTRVRLQVAARRRPADRQRTCATRWDAGVRPAAAARRAARRATAAPSAARAHRAFLDNAQKKSSSSAWLATPERAADMVFMFMFMFICSCSCSCVMFICSCMCTCTCTNAIYTSQSSAMYTQHVHVHQTSAMYRTKLRGGDTRGKSGMLSCAQAPAAVLAAHSGSFCHPPPTRVGRNQYGSR